MYKKILIPLDNSQTDETILEHVRALAKLTRSHIVLMHVADGFGARLQNDLNLADSKEMTEDQAYLDAQSLKLSKEGFKVSAFLVHGKEPAKGILDIAQSEECDLIAMSTHGHGFVQDVILGSVADKLRHSTGIPILMIRSNIK